jgi:predicted amidohydrolase YtcJ
MASHFRGAVTYSQDDANQLVATFLAQGLDLQIHCNGDAAIDLALDAVSAYMSNHPTCAAQRLVTIIHCQTVRQDQLIRMKALGCVHPSFFVGHTWYWGDRHRDIFLGPERASSIDPVASGLRHGLIVSCHHDSPVVSASMLDIIFSAVTRLTRQGNVLGSHECVSVDEALKTVTVNAARQLGCLNSKGSLSEGKDADIVILSQNILSVAPAAIRSIRVTRTIARGRTVFCEAEAQTNSKM